MRLKISLLTIFLCMTVLVSSCSSNGDSNISNENSTAAGTAKTAAAVTVTDAAYIKDDEGARIAVDRDGSMYMIDEKTIHFFDKDGNTVKTVSDSNYYYEAVTAEDGMVFVYDTSGILSKFDSKGVLVKQYQMIPQDKTTSYYVLKMVYMKWKIYINAENRTSGSSNYCLLEYDLEADKLQEFKIEQMCDFVKYKDGKLIIFKGTGSQVLIFDPSTNKVVEEFEIPGISGFNSYYNEKMDVLYSVCQGNINIISMSGKKKQESYSIGSIPASGWAAFIDNICAFYNKDNKKIVKIDIDSLGKAANLTVLTCASEKGDYFSKVLTDFGLQYPNVNIKFDEISGEEYANTLNTKVMAGDTDFDIFLLISYDACGYINKGAFEDLNKYSSIKNDFKDMLDGIEALCSYKGKLFGVPVRMYNGENVYKLNTGLIEKLKLGIPRYNWTWDEFEELAQKLYGSGSYVMQSDQLEFWFDCMQGTYDGKYVDMAEGTCDYNVKDIEERLKLTKKLYEQKMILDRGRFEDGDNQDKVLLQATGIPMIDVGDETVLPQPMLKGEEAYPFYVYYLCINRSSKNKEMAAAFLEKCISKETQSKDGVAGGPLLYKDKAVYQNSNYIKYFDNELNYNAYIYMLKYSKRVETIGIHRGDNDLVMEYLRGNITSGKAAQGIYNKVMMAVNE